MKLQFVFAPQENPQQDYNSTIEIGIEQPKSPKYFWIVAVLLLTLVVGGYIVYDPSGEPKLSPERQAKRDSSIAEVYKRKKDNCEQYVLKVKIAGWYPILKDGERNATDSIWLNVNEVWRYGKTCIEEKGRYPNGVYYKDTYWKLTKDHLKYEIQFEGSEIECLAEEKRKIFDYPLLPECLRRDRKLIRPAGNKNDN